jgi:hypothetical protein
MALAKSPIDASPSRGLAMPVTFVAPYQVKPPRPTFVADDAASAAVPVHPVRDSTYEAMKSPKIIPPAQPAAPTSISFDNQLGMLTETGPINAIQFHLISLFQPFL